MKTRRLSSWAIALLTSCLPLAAAERPCAPFPWIWNYTPPPTCVVTQYWSRPIDLDGDQVPEFIHERFYAKQDWNNGLGEDPDRYAACYQHDDIEAFYPEPHVEVFFAQMWHPSEQGYWVRMPEGLPIEPVTQGGWRPFESGWEFYTTWDFPTWPPTSLTAHGLGWVHRGWNLWNMFGCDGFDPRQDCRGEEYTGYMGLSFVGSYDRLFGFRMRRPDGWHLGWIRLRQTWSDERYAAKESVLSVADSVIHPDPDTVILAGQPPQPRLYARVEGAEAVLHWSAAWEDYTLQRSPSLTAPDWQPVPGVTNHSVRLPRPATAAFFRLSQLVASVGRSSR